MCSLTLLYLVFLSLQCLALSELIVRIMRLMNALLLCWLLLCCCCLVAEGQTKLPATKPTPKWESKKPFNDLTIRDKCSTGKCCPPQYRCCFTHFYCCKMLSIKTQAVEC